MTKRDDFNLLEEMTYSGRGIIVGMTQEGNKFIGYSLTGRSPSSQARKLVYDEESGVIRTSVTNKEQLEQGSPALLLYPAIALTENGIVASNGAQTKLIFSEVKRMPIASASETLSKSLSMNYWEYDKKEGWIDITSFEPDAPNSTPRISACLIKDRPEAAFHMVKRKCNERSEEIHEFPLTQGKGELIATYYGGNENPLRPFERRPLEVRITSKTAEEIVENIYKAIYGGEKPGDNYRVSAAVMMLRGGKPEVAIRNRVEVLS